MRKFLVMLMVFLVMLKHESDAVRNRRSTEQDDNGQSPNRGAQPDYNCINGRVVDIEDIAGVIASPRDLINPRMYPINMACAWRVLAPPDMIIRFEVQLLSLEGSMPNCPYDRLQIYDGSTIYDHSLAILCDILISDVILYSYVTTGNLAYVTFVSDEIMTREGFLLRYEAVGTGTQPPAPTTPTYAGCGESQPLIMTSRTGSLRSPGRVDQYISDADCAWIIAAEENLVIEVRFQQFALQGILPECSSDSLTLRDGNSSSSDVLVQLCGRLDTEDMMFISSTNYMYIEFTSDSTVEFDGFQLSYNAVLLPTEEPTEVCDANPVVFVSDSGTFSTPRNLDDNGVATYPPSQQCLWLMNTTENQIIELSFSEFFIEGVFGEPCYFDKVTIYDGGTIQAPVLDTICGNFPGTDERGQPTMQWTSSSSQMLVQFISDDQIGKLGFTAEFSTQLTATEVPDIQFCSRNTTLSGSGTLQSSLNRDTGMYVRDDHCEWLLTVPENYIVSFVLESFSLEGVMPSCSTDYLALYDGDSASSPSIDVLCGAALITNHYVASGNVMFVVYHTDDEVQNAGFTAFFSLIEPPTLPPEVTTCSANRSYTSVTGTIRTPSDPTSIDLYPNNITCGWFIAAPENHIIHLNFSEFSLEGPLPLCAYDRVIIYDGDLVLAQLCGDVTNGGPAVYQSTTNIVRIQFISDISEQRSGFVLHYEMIGTASDCGDTDLVVPTSGDVNLVYPSSSGPAMYAPNTRCEWNLMTLEDDYVIDIEFMSLDLEDGNGLSCYYDSLTLYQDSGTSDDVTMLTEVCGSDAPGMLRTDSSAVRVVFQSDQSVEGEGFHIRVTARDTSTISCTHGEFTQLTNPTGSFSSPRDIGSDNYPPMFNCGWIITTQQHNLISLNFSAFDLEGSTTSECRFDYVNVYDGPDSDSSLVYNVCGSTIPIGVTSSSKAMTVTFRTDLSRHYAGFIAHYHVLSMPEGSPCYNNSITMIPGDFNTGQIHSPLRPGTQLYPSDTHCTWQINAPEGTLISVTFQSFDLQAGSMILRQCNYDSVVIYDGTMSDSDVIITQCGVGVPEALMSTSNSIRLEFNSDSNVERGGFQLQYTIATPAEFGLCSATDVTLVDSEDDIIQSPLSLGSRIYPNNAMCRWKITTDEHKVIRLNFISFSMEENTECTYDTLTIYDGPDEYSSVIQVLCGTSLPSAIFSTSNNLFLIFESDNSVGLEGFMATYQGIVPDACTPGYILDLYELDGSIASPLVSNSLLYPPEMDCAWRINVPDHYIVTIEFTSFELEQGTSCEYDSLSITDIHRDGTQSEHRLFCGFNITIQAMTSSTNIVLVQFLSDEDVELRGFHLTYSAVLKDSACQGTVQDITDSTGYITSPLVRGTDVYPNNAHCMWRVTVQPNQMINVRLHMINIEPSDDCAYDTIKLYDGAYNNTESLLIAICTNDVTIDHVVTSGNQLLVEFQSDDSVQMQGFSIYYEAIDILIPLPDPCVAKSSLVLTHAEPVQTFGLTTIRRHNGDELTCSWGIEAPQNMLLQLRMVSFGRPSSDYCTSAFLTTNSTSENPRTIPMCMLYYSDDSQPFIKQDLEADYLEVSIRWIGLVPSPHLMFEVRAAPVPVPTTTPAPDINLIACGTKRPAVFTQVEGSFRSPVEASGQYATGLLCQWLIHISTLNVIVLEFTQFFVEYSRDCGYDRVDVFDGVFADPNFRIGGALCGYFSEPLYVTSSSNTLLVQMVTDHAIQRTGFTASYRIDVPELDPGGLPGYRIDACGIGRPQLLTSQTGSITSPVDSESGLYPPNKSCSWLLQAGDEEIIVLTVVALDLEGQLCLYDYITFYDGPTPESPRLLRLCDRSEIVTTVLTSGNQIYLDFVSDDQQQFAGFTLEYEFQNQDYGQVPGVCDLQATTLIDSTGIIRSPIIPGTNLYPPYSSCVWHLQSTSDKVIEISFLMISMEPSSSCVYDSLSVYDGMSPDAPLLHDSLCGSPTVEPIRSTGSDVMIHFYSDSSVNSWGFLLSYTHANRSTDRMDEADEDVCTEVPTLLELAQGSISYPANRSENYKVNKICRWFIQTTDDQIIMLNFTTLSLEDHITCAYDRVRAYDGETILHSTVTISLCGDMEYKVFYSRSSSVLLEFISDGSNNGAGFVLEYSNMNKTINNTTHTDNPPCGSRIDLAQRQLFIVGGQESVAGDWPWQSLLLHSHHRACGATIIGKNWAMTAAHCVISGEGTTLPASVLTLRVGDLDLLRLEGHERDYSVKTIHIHDKTLASIYSTREYDVALLELHGSGVVFDDFVRPVCLGEETLPEDSSCTTTGWGRTIATDSQSRSTILQQTDLNTISKSLCQSYFTDIIQGRITENMICAHPPPDGVGDKGTCKGDSGGGLFCLDHARDVYVQYGVTSWGDNTCGAQGRPSVFTNVPRVKEWILSVVHSRDEVHFIDG